MTITRPRPAGRSFTGPADVNHQFSSWIAGSNQRTMQVLCCRPAHRVEADKAAMLSLPPVEPVTGWHLTTRLPRDHYVRVEGNNYSIHPAVIGRRVEVVVDLQRVVASGEGQVVADHERSWAKHQSLTDSEHAAAAVRLRRARLQVPRPTPLDEVEQRDLAVYDALSEKAV